MPVTRALTAAVLLGLAVVAAGCGGSAAPADLAGRDFVATEVRGHQLVDGSEITLSFADDRVSARAGCNTLMGAATWDDGVLSVPTDGLASTLMACSEDLTAQDEWLRALLTSSPAVALDDGVLTVGDASEGLVLTEVG